MAMRSKEKRDFWRTVLELHEASGLTVAAFCEQEGLKVATFYAWRRKLLGEATRGRDAKTRTRRSEERSAAARTTGGGRDSGGGPQFATIAVVDDSSCMMELQLRGAIIRIRETADDNTVRRLLGILREA